MNDTTSIPTVEAENVLVAKASTIAESAHEIALAYEIDSPAMYTAAGDELRGIKKRKDEIEELRFSLTRPLDTAKSRIMDLFRRPVARLEEAEALLKKGMLTYQQAEREKQEKARREAEAKARAEREEQERQRKAALEAEQKALAEAEEARRAGDASAARAAQEAAEAAAATAEEAQAQIEIADVAPPSVPMVAAPTAAGVSTRQTWKHEVTSLADLVTAAAAGIAAGDTTLLGYLQADDKALGGVARALKQRARIPGVRIYAEDGLSVRKAAA
jgi:uncharacterized membrane protein YqiK